MRRLCTVLTLVAVVGCGASPFVATPSPPAGQTPLNIALGLSLVDASFATAIHDREPERVSKTLSIPTSESSNLLFWMELACTGLCEKRLTEKGQVTVLLEWYKEEGGLLLKQASTPLDVKGTRWRTWGWKRVSIGKWVAVVRAEDSSWVCLGDQCYFSIAVQP
jgi:hypothetical protein